MTALLAALLFAAPDAGPAASRPVEISAPRLTIDQKARRAEYSGGVKVVRDSTTLTCKTLVAEYGEGQRVRSIEATGEVVAVDGDRTVTGERASYDNVTGVLTMTGDPVARQGAREVAGDEVRFTTGADRVEVKKARTRVVDPKVPGADKRVAIDADALVLDAQRNRATWQGNVRVRRAAMTLTAPELTAVYDDAGTITRLDATRGLEAREADRWAKGQRATFQTATGVLVLTGKPEARQGTTRLKGSKVTFITGRDLLDVENAVSVMEVERGRRP